METVAARDCDYVIHAIIDLVLKGHMPCIGLYTCIHVTTPLFAGLALKLAFFPDAVSSTSKDTAEPSQDDSRL